MSTNNPFDRRLLEAAEEQAAEDDDADTTTASDADGGLDDLREDVADIGDEPVAGTDGEEFEPRDPPPSDEPDTGGDGGGRDTGGGEQLREFEEDALRQAGADPEEATASRTGDGEPGRGMDGREVSAEEAAAIEAAAAEAGVDPGDIEVDRFAALTRTPSGQVVGQTRFVPQLTPEARRRRAREQGAEAFQERGDLLASPQAEQLAGQASAEIDESVVNVLQGVDPGDVDVVETDDDTFEAELAGGLQRDLARIDAANRLGVEESDVILDREDGGFTARPTESAFREQVAAQEDVDPDTVTVVEEDGELVAEIPGGTETELDRVESFAETTRTEGARGAAEEAGARGAGTIAEARGVESSDLEEQFLPSVDVDVGARDVDFEPGDPVGATQRALSEREQELREGLDDVPGGAEGGLAGAAALGVAAPEPATTAGGAVVLGALAAGAAANELLDDDLEASTGEVEVGERVTATEVDLGTGIGATEVGIDEGVGPTVVEPSVGPTTTEVGIDEGVGPTEVDVPTDDGATVPSEETGQPVGDTVVPEEFPLAGRDFPADPSQDVVGGTRPEDVVDVTPQAAMQQQQARAVEQERTVEEFVVGEELRRRRRAEERELQEILRGPSGEVVLEDDTGLDPVQRREFFTGESAVIGRETERAEEATQLDVLEPTEALEQDVVGQQTGADVFAGLDADVASGMATEQMTATETALDVDAMVETTQATTPATAAPTGFETPLETVVESPFEPVVEAPVETATPTESSVLPALEPDDPDRRQRLEDVGFFEREIIAPIEEDPLADL